MLSRAYTVVVHTRLAGTLLRRWRARVWWALRQSGCMHMHECMPSVLCVTSVQACRLLCAHLYVRVCLGVWVSNVHACVFVRMHISARGEGWHSDFGTGSPISLAASSMYLSGICWYARLQSDLQTRPQTRLVQIVMAYWLWRIGYGILVMAY